MFCTNRPKEEVIDLVRQQYSLYQLESIPEDFFLISEEQKKGTGTSKLLFLESYRTNKLSYFQCSDK